LEGLRRAGIVERVEANCWRIPEDFEARAAEYDVSRGTGVRVRVLSAFDLDQQVTSDGATWLDRHIVNPNPSPIVGGGFGAQVLDALEQRKDELVRRGQGWRTSAGEFGAKANLIETLRRQEVERVGRKLASERGLAFNSIGEGDTIRGKLIGSVQLASGRFAMIDDGPGFSLVPWLPVIEEEVGREVIGVMRGGDVSWQLDRARGLGIGL
jgi:hypothetical protein